MRVLVSEMVGMEFVDAIIRIASRKIATGPLEDRFRDLMETWVLANALRSQSELFRAEVASAKVRAVFQRHKQELQRVFRYYASMNAIREHQSTVDLKEFTVLVKDCKLVGTFITEHTVKQVLASIQREEDGTSGDDKAASSSLRVDFNEFQEVHDVTVAGASWRVEPSHAHGVV